MASIITDTGLRLINRAFEPVETLVIKYIVVTDDDTAAATTDTLATFCDRTAHNYTMLHVINYTSTGVAAYFYGEAGATEANYTWTKIGIIDDKGNLIAQEEVAYTKTSPNKKEVVFQLGATR